MLLNNLLKIFTPDTQRGLPFATIALLLSCLPSLSVQADKTAADYYVRSLPGAPDGPLLKMHAG